jgi:hypothetical protein
LAGVLRNLEEALSAGSEIAMYQISRAIYRELAPYVESPRPGEPGSAGTKHAELLRACEAVIERLGKEPYNFSDPARTLFYDIRTYFPMNAQERVHRVVFCYMEIARRFVNEHPLLGYEAVAGEAPRCRATTRKGETCRRTPLPRNGYCPSHQHLADTEDREMELVAA